MILIAPWPKALRVEDKPHPKTYPHWQTLIDTIKKIYPNETIVQVGVSGEIKLNNADEYFFDKNLSELKDKLLECKTWISVDSFFQHFAWKHKKVGITLFGPSNPAIFGHKENINLFADESYFRKQQFWLWEQAECVKSAFVSPDIVLNHLKHLL